MDIEQTIHALHQSRFNSIDSKNWKIQVKLSNGELVNGKVMSYFVSGKLQEGYVNINENGNMRKIIFSEIAILR